MKINKHDILKVEYIENYPISELSTYKTKGNIRGAFFPKTEKEMIICYLFLEENHLPFIIVGNGSNLLISPKTNVLAISTKRLKQIIKISGNQAYFSASVLLAKAYQTTSTKGLKGFERLAGIPASIGGAIKNNASAFEQSIFDHLDKIKIFKDGKIKILKKHEITYSYHCTDLKNIIILSATFSLPQENSCKITQTFIESQKMRQERQPKGFSCGSLFKNPTFASAGKLIEQCNLKGIRKGDAVISEKHANFIINEGDATFDDVLYLIKLCQIAVKENFNIELIPEVEIIE